MVDKHRIELAPGEEVAIATSNSKRYDLKNVGGELVIVSWYEPLRDSTGRRFVLKDSPDMPALEQG